MNNAEKKVRRAPVALSVWSLCERVMKQPDEEEVEVLCVDLTEPEMDLFMASGREQAKHILAF